MKFLICFLPIFFAITVSSQDQIILRSGQEITANVVEIGVDEIKYNKFSNPDGPVYVLMRSDVFMIRYANGDKDVFSSEIKNSDEKIQKAENSIKEKLSVKNAFFGLRYYKGANKMSKSTFINTLKTDPEAYDYYSSYGINRGAGHFFGGISVLGAIYAVVFSLNGQSQNALITAIGSLVTGTIGRIFDRKAKENLELAIATYNRNILYK